MEILDLAEGLLDFFNHIGHFEDPAGDAASLKTMAEKARAG